MQSEISSSRVPLWRLLAVFLKVGATGFGGAMPMLAMIQAEVLHKYRWVTPQEFTDAVTLGQITPGPVAIDTTAHLGYRLRGWPGAILSVIAFVLPSFLLMLGLTALYLQYGSLPQVSGAFRGIGAAVVAIILSVSYRLGRASITDSWAGLILVGAALAFAVFALNIVLIIIVAGAVGFLVYRNRPAGSIPPSPKSNGGIRGGR